MFTAKVSFDVDRCKGCGLCVMICPRHIVTIDMQAINRKGYHPAGITEPERCIACAGCAKICPDSVICVERFEEGECDV